MLEQPSNAHNQLTRRGFVAIAALAGTVPGLATRALAQSQPEAPVQHPLDPLTAAEINGLRSLLSTHPKLGARTRYAWVQLKEPPKEAVLAFKPGDPVEREAFVVALSPEHRTAYEIRVDLRKRSIAAFKDLQNLQVFLTESEFERVNEIVDASAQVRTALERRGYRWTGKISDRFFIDCYAPGESSVAENGRTIRAGRVLFADRQGGINDYGPYVEGLMAMVDVYAGKVLTIEDIPGAIAHARVPLDVFNRDVLGPPEPSRDLSVSPATIGDVTLSGRHVAWGHWEFRYSFNQREGLVLHQIAYRDGKRLRSICYRAAVSEMLVPYADPSRGWVWREFYDGGEYGLGAVSSSVRPGKELPGNALSLDVALPNENLTGMDVLPNRIYFYERDAGTMLMHVQAAGDRRVYARAKELVVGFVATIGNYDYMFGFVFRQDASFGFEAALQGLILNKTVASTSCASCGEQAGEGPGTYDASGDDRFGTLVSAGMVGTTHQHWINLRLDFDVDGTANAVEEYNVMALAPDSKSNPAGRALALERTVFAQAKDAARNLNETTNRSWVVYNPSKRSAIGQFAGYEIVADGNTFSSIPESRYGEPSSFVQRHFWVTRYDPEQLYAAGRYPNQYPPGYADDLFHYAGEQGIYDQDVVVWYSMGFTHVTRPEDFPIMSSEKVAVNFKPRGFFERSPVLGYARLD